MELNNNFSTRSQKGSLVTFLLVLAIIGITLITGVISLELLIRWVSLGRVQHACEAAATHYARGMHRVRNNEMSKHDVKAIDYTYGSLYSPNTSTPISGKLGNLKGAKYGVEYTEASQVLLSNLWGNRIDDSTLVDDISQDQCYKPHEESRFNKNKNQLSLHNDCTGGTGKVSSPIMSLTWAFESSAYGYGVCCPFGSEEESKNKDFCVNVSVLGRMDPVMAGGLPFLHDLDFIKDGNFNVDCRVVVMKMAKGASALSSESITSEQVPKISTCPIGSPDIPKDAIVNPPPGLTCEPHPDFGCLCDNIAILNNCGVGPGPGGVGPGPGGVGPGPGGVGPGPGCPPDDPACRPTCLAPPCIPVKCEGQECCEKPPCKPVECIATAFNEDYYLTTYPDVKAAVDDGRFRDGAHHFAIYGRGEGRAGNACCLSLPGGCKKLCAPIPCSTDKECDSQGANNCPCNKTTGKCGGGCPSPICRPGENCEIKRGNNGTVSCDEYCRGSLVHNWPGVVGKCVISCNQLTGEIVSCSNVPGFLNGPELTCGCQVCPNITCNSTTDCVNAGGTNCNCDASTHKCVSDCGKQCTKAAECAGSRSGCTVCDPTSHKCGSDCSKVSCSTDKECQAAGVNCSCNTATGKCGNDCGKQCTQAADCAGSKIGCTTCDPTSHQCTDCGKACTKAADCAGSRSGCTVCEGGVCKPPECGSTCILDLNCQGMASYTRDGIANSCTKCSLIAMTCIPDQCGSACNASKDCPNSSCPVCSVDKKCISDSCNKPCNSDSQCANSAEGCDKCVNRVCTKGSGSCTWDVNNLLPAEVTPDPPPGVNRLKECDLGNLNGGRIDSAFCGKDGDGCIAPWVEPAPEGIFPGLSEAQKDENAVKVFKCACNSPTSGLSWDFQRYAFPGENAADCPPASDTGQVDNSTCSSDGALCKSQEAHIFGKKIFKCENTSNSTGVEECRWDLNSFTVGSLKKGSACPVDANNPEKFNNVACSKAEAGQTCYKPRPEPFTVRQMSKGWRKIFKCDCAPTPGLEPTCSWDVNGFDPVAKPTAGSLPVCQGDAGARYFDGSTCEGGTDDGCIAADAQTLPNQDGDCTGGFCSNFAGKACVDSTDCSSSFPYADDAPDDTKMVKLFRCSGTATSPATWDFQNVLDLNNPENMALPLCPDASTLPGNKVDGSPCNGDRCRTGDRIFRCEKSLPGNRLDLNNWTPAVDPLNKTPNFEECPASNGTVNNVDCSTKGEGWRCQKTGGEADQPTLAQLREGWKKIFRCDCPSTLPATVTPTPPNTPTRSTPTPVPIPTPPPAPPNTPTRSTSIPAPPITPTTPPPPITVPVPTPTPTTPPPSACPAGQAMIQEINMTTKQPYNRCALVCSAGTHLSSLMNWDNSVTDSCVPDGSSTSTECDPGYSKSSTSGNCIPDDFDGSSWMDQSGGSDSDCVDTDLDIGGRGGSEIKSFCLDAGERHKLNTTGRPCNQGGQCELEFGYNSPLLIVFDSIDKIKLETITEFSFDGKNKLKTYWVNPDLNLAYLVSDFNQNGLIDDGTELFGNHTNRKQYANGFEALADTKDKDKNGIIEGAELKGLMLWFDKNANAKTDKGELISLKAKGIQKISLKDLINTQKPFGSNGYALPYALGAAESLKGKFDVLDIWFKEVK